MTDLPTWLETQRAMLAAKSTRINHVMLNTDTYARLLDVVEAAEAWIAGLEAAGGHYRDGIPGRLMDALEALVKFADECEARGAERQLERMKDERPMCDKDDPEDRDCECCKRWRALFGFRVKP